MNDSDLQAQIDEANAYQALLVPALFQEWAPWVVAAANLQPRQRVLDVACGTGVLARVAADCVGSSGSVVGLDANPGMLAVAAELAPDSAQAHYWLGNAYGYQIGRVGTLSQGFMAPKLRDAFERAIALDPDLHDARSSLMEYYLQAPAIAGGSVEKARAQAAELERRDPPRGHYARARLAMQPRGEVRMGMNSEVGAVAGFEIAVSSDYIQGRDPAQVYESCVYQRSGELPSRPLYDLPPPGRGMPE